MAISYSHKFGQIIGDVLEIAVEPFLRNFCKENNLFLDVKGQRAARSGINLTWLDINDNKHNLDFVIERNGIETTIGHPVAFIECAWRRYTKHSKNKAQEIQGAIIPLFEKYKKDHPFLGVILAGEFTENSLTQLKSLGFSILFFSYDLIVKAFKKIDIDAYFNEQTDESHFEEQVRKWEKSTQSQKEMVYIEIANLNLLGINNFMTSLKLKVDRTIKSIRLWTMYGNVFTFTDITSAKLFVTSFDPNYIDAEFIKFEAEIEYNNSDIIKVSYREKNDLLRFLSNFV